MTFKIVNTRPGWRDTIVTVKMFAWLRDTFTAEVDFLYGKPIPEYNNEWIPISVPDYVYSMIVLKCSNNQNG